MREIKFRAWDPYNRVMYKPTRDEDALEGPSYEISMWDGGWEMCEITAIGKRPVVASRTRTGESGGTLMQYTGLKDKNGVEIYEEDIVEIQHPAWHERCKVIFDRGSFTLYQLKPALADDNHTLTRMSAFELWEENDIWKTEVIGNIYENPELLEANQ